METPIEIHRYPSWSLTNINMSHPDAIRKFDEIII